jgi:hypothetical protein
MSRLTVTSVSVRKRFTKSGPISRLLYRNWSGSCVPPLSGSAITIFPFHLGLRKSQYDVNSWGFTSFVLW